MKKIQMFLFILTASLFVGCSSDDGGGSGSIKETPVKNLSEINGTWILEDVKSKNGQVLLPDCDRSECKLVVDSFNKTFEKHRKVRGWYNDELDCVNLYTWTDYTNLTLISQSNIQAIGTDVNGSRTYRFSVILKGDKLEFSLYQIQSTNGNTTIPSEKQVVFHYKKM